MSRDLGKVSVIVPVYNVEKYFDECIESILNQTYRNLEILIVDDGTKDNCGKKADEYAQRDERIQVFHKENDGLSMARNTGLKHATGEYYCFIDSDDYYEPNFIEKMVDALVRHNADMVFCNFFACYVDRKEIGKKFLEFEDGKEFSSDEYLRGLYTYSGNYCYVWNKMYKKAIFQDLEYKKMLCEDAQIMLSIADRCEKIIYVSDALYDYRKRKSSLGNKNPEKMLMGEIGWVGEHMDRLKADHRDSLFNLAQKLYIRKILENYHLCSAKVRKEQLKPLLMKEMKAFIHNPGVDKKLRMKYMAVSLMPYIYGKLVFKSQVNDSFWE